MNFEANQELDETRSRYKADYDTAFIKRRFMKKDSEDYHRLTKQLRFMEHRTNAFINKHSLYFSRKRYFIFERMERHGVFGDRPVTDKHVESVNRSRAGRVPKKIFKHKFCVECQKEFIWYQHAPSEMCKECRSIKPCLVVELRGCDGHLS